MANYDVFLASSLEKVFPSRRPRQLPPDSRLSVWPGNRCAVQLVYRAEDIPYALKGFRIEVCGAPTTPHLRSVELIPAEMPCFEVPQDSDYITKEPGLYPDLLQPLQDNRVTIIPRQYRSVWISWEIPPDATPGEHRVCISLTAPDDSLRFENNLTLRICSSMLPPQTLLHTEWFHGDCLANYYDTEVFSPLHWQILENFIASAARHGVNLLLTPVFTPPLDTAVGGQRRTIQLVDVILENGTYFFGFEKLDRWISLCKKYDIANLEIAHLYTQWGAGAAPKIMATVDGNNRQIFGWDTPATGEAYRAFLATFLPALRGRLEELGYGPDRVFFHISDEPGQGQLEQYRAAREQVLPLLDGCHIMDTLSSFDFYRHGLVTEPVVHANHIQEFFDANVPNLWVYYCGGSAYSPNRMLAMESYRNRIMGVLMYLYNVKGFLHWGFNFYSSQYSLRSIDPYRNTHGDFWVPAGDTHLVYPGPDGTPLDSLRAEVQDEALADLRALQLLEKLAGREAVEKLIHEGCGMIRITFMDYPRQPSYLLQLRERLADAICALQPDTTAE